MRILYLTPMFLTPENGSNIYTDLAEEISINHKITIVAFDSNLKPGQSVESVERGMNVYRIGVLPYYNVNFVKKGIAAITQFYFVKKSLKKILKEIEFNFAIYESPPVTINKTIKYIKKRCNIKTLLMLKDIFPQNAVDLGVFKRSSLFYKYFLNQERKLYKVSDIIGCMSEGNMRYIKDNNSAVKNKVRYFPNTKKISNITKDENNNKDIIFKGLNIPIGNKVILFGGNMGKPQNIELLNEIIVEFKNNNEVTFLLIGRGKEKELIINSVENNKLNNVVVMDNLNREIYENILPLVDIGLVLLNPNFTIPNYPSRILSYMEYGIPIFAATDIVTDLKNLIQENKIGVWSDATNPSQVISSLKDLLKSDKLESMGENGYKLIREKFDVRDSVKLLEKYNKELV